MKLLINLTLLFFSHALFAAPIDELTKIVNIKSGTSNIKGVEQTLDYVAERLQKMKFTVERVPSPSGKYARLLIAKRPSTNPKFITLLAHADTVFDEPTKFTSISF